MKWIKSFHLGHVVIELIMERNMENPKSHPALFQTQCLTRPQGHNYKARIQRLQLDSTHPLSLLDKTLEQMLPSDRNAVRKRRQLVLFLCTISRNYVSSSFRILNGYHIPEQCVLYLQKYVWTLLERVTIPSGEMFVS